ncbi:MAG: NADAR family protein [Candidatus Bathyarchaeota archaeon]|nr:NADAR family protein [Candidatus Bathyarchaeota archaeon]
MTAKMKRKKFRSHSRDDLKQKIIQIMRWCLKVKLFQNRYKFSELLLETGDNEIVEESKKDDFWGAIPSDKNLLVGINALGRLLTELRGDLKMYKEDNYILISA